MSTVLVLSGPNANLFGEREPEIYGTDTLEDYVDAVRKVVEPEVHPVSHFQSHPEVALVDAIQEARGHADAIIINPTALSHYSYALADALATFDGVKIEVHVSNPQGREEWRQHSVVSPYVHGSIAGFGKDSYRLAAEVVLGHLTSR